MCCKPTTSPGDHIRTKTFLGIHFLKTDEVKKEMNACEKQLREK